MTGIRTAFGQAALDILAGELDRCRLGGVTGALHVIGRPGGVFHLRQGAVVAVDSPGAPGASALLMRSGRVSEADWTAALRAGAEARSSQAELVARGHLGSTELRVVGMMAAQDAAFATVAGSIEKFAIDSEPADVLLSMVQDLSHDWLLRETARRLHALASLPMPVAPHRERVAPVRGIDRSQAALTPRQQEILALANGRRSARDIAFLAGRGVYPVTVEISRMLSAGLVEVVSGGSAAAPPTAPTHLLVLRRRNDAGSGSDAIVDAVDLLPRRHPGSSGINETLAPTRAASGRQGLPRLLDLIRGAPPASPGPEEPQALGIEKGNTSEP